MGGKVGLLKPKRLLEILMLDFMMGLLIGQEKQDRSEKTYELYREKFNRHIFLLRQISLMNVLLNDLICQLIQFL